MGTFISLFYKNKTIITMLTSEINFQLMISNTNSFTNFYSFLKYICK